MHNLEALQRLSLSLTIVIWIIVLTLIGLQLFGIRRVRDILIKVTLREIRTGLIITLLVFSFGQTAIAFRIMYLGG